jgi:hypothetical protein
MSDDITKKFHEEQLKRVRNLKPLDVPKPKPNFTPKISVMRKAGRGR